MAIPAPGDSGHESPAAVFTGPVDRLHSIDVFRGLVLAFMLFTPPFGSHWPLLRHAAWDGWALADLVFPAFLVASGASLSFLLRSGAPPETRLRLVRRAVALLVLGILYNAYGTVGADMSRVRLTGVLQMIGVAGALASVAVLVVRRWFGRDRPWLIGGVAVALPSLYGLGLALLGGRCVESVGCSPYHSVDVGLFGSTHVYREGAVAYDPEGLLVMVSAAGVVLAGYLAGLLLQRSRRDVVRAGRVLIAVGLGLYFTAHLIDLVQPINKRLHTPAFQGLAVGVSLILLGILVLVLDRRDDAGSRGVRFGVAHPFVVLGRNALIVYLAERFLIQTLAASPVGDDSSSAAEWLLDWAAFAGGGGAELVVSTMLLGAILTLSYLMHLLRWRVAL